jgi:hypothetical protein
MLLLAFVPSNAAICLAIVRLHSAESNPHTAAHVFVGVGVPVSGST